MSKCAICHSEHDGYYGAYCSNSCRSIAIGRYHREQREALRKLKKKYKE